MAAAAKIWTHSDVLAWFTAKLPDDWFAAEPLVTFDREEILVLGELPWPDGVPPCGTIVDPADGAAEDPTEQRANDDEVRSSTTIRDFREATREVRMAIADEAEVLWERKVSWGVHCGGYQILFTTQSVPVMTRLRMDERRVLDTLISGGVARSRSEALAWCVRLVGRHQGEWIDQLREAMAEVDRVRAEGPRP